MTTMRGGFDVTVLGCSGSYASVDSACTGYLLRSSEATVLLDCGPGTLGPLQATTALEDLTAIVVTHCHPDHWLELPVMRNVFTYFAPRAGIPVYGTAQTREMDVSVTVGRPGVTDPFDWVTIDETASLTIGDQQWRFSRTDHPVETLAVRVDVGDRSFAFSADSGPDWEMSTLGPGIDLAFVDSSHTSDWEGNGIPHMSSREAAECAARAGVERLVLTHLIPGSDPEAHVAEAREAYRGPVDVARPGRRFDI